MQQERATGCTHSYAPACALQRRCPESLIISVGDREADVYELFAAAAQHSLDGFLGRKADGEPGTKSLWLGLQRRDDITTIYRLLTEATGPPGVQPIYG